MAKIKRKAPNETITEYYKVRAKIGARIRAQREQGYYGVELPPIPKNIQPGSIRRLLKYTVKYIREKSTTFKSTVTGKEITVIELREEAAQKRSEAGKKAYATRIQRQEENYRTFAETFDVKYRPTKQNIVIDNFLKDVISKITPSDFFQELESVVFEERNTSLMVAKRPEFRFTIKENADIIISKIAQIIRDNISDEVYRAIINSGKKDSLMNNIYTALHYGPESDITEMENSRSKVLEILNGGKLSKEDYDNLSRYSDDEA